MIVVIARVQSKPGQEAGLIAAARATVAATQAEEGCLSYTFLQDASQPSLFMFVEEWADSAALRQHMGSEHVGAFQDAARQCVASQQISLHTVEKSRTL